MSEPSISQPAFFLRFEALCALVAACLAYNHWFPHHWTQFACWFLVPDLTFLLYVRGPGVVASSMYNVAHTYALPASLGAYAISAEHAFAGRISLVWIAHIALDRLLGMGLKYADSLQMTHLQRISRVHLQALK